MDFWSKLPSLRPVKGISLFLYIWTHWEEVSTESRKRDERVQAVDVAASMLIRLKVEAHGS